MIDWSVLGPFRIVVDDTTLTTSPIAEDGRIDEYTWKQLVALHVALRTVLAGESVELPVLDNPGVLELTPTTDGVELTFDPVADGWESRSRTVTIDALAKAVLEATNQHRTDLLDMNAALEESSLIGRLDEQRRQTENRLQDHEISVTDESE